MAAVPEIVKQLLEIYIGKQTSWFTSLPTVTVSVKEGFLV